MIEHVTETNWPESYDSLHKLTAEYIQDADNYKSNGSNSNILKVGTEPGGYFYISTERWAFDTIDELINVLNDFKNKVKFTDGTK